LEKLLGCFHDSDPGVPSRDPFGGERAVLFCAVLPGEVAAFEDVELALGQPTLQPFGVRDGHERVVASDDADTKTIGMQRVSRSSSSSCATP
jgi:hypothetical protein